MRKNFGAKPFTYPQPVYILAAYDENGTPNAMNAAWAGISNDTEISFCLGSDRKTLANLKKRGAFTVSMGTVSQVEACDYVGIVSGNKVPNKFELAGLQDASLARLLMSMPMNLFLERMVRLILNFFRLLSSTLFIMTIL